MRNILINEIRSLERQKEREDKIKERSVSNLFLMNQVKILEEQKYEEQIAQLNEKLNRLENGELDDEINAEIMRNSILFREKEKAIQQTKRAKKDEDFEKKRTEELRFKAEKRAFKEENYDMKSSYKYMLKIEIPKYIQCKLNNLPNNHGYRFRGVVFYGIKPKTDENVSKIFEIKKDNIVCIEESTEFETRFYEQRGQQQRVLKKIKPRRQIKRVFIQNNKEINEKNEFFMKKKDFPHLKL